MAEENTKAASGKIKEEEVKKVALTFDDGPNPDHTETLLEGLKELENTSAYQELVRLYHFVYEGKWGLMTPEKKE